MKNQYGYDLKKIKTPKKAKAKAQAKNEK